MFSGRISFDEIDANRDGVIDRYEFEAFLRSRSRSPPMYRERDDAERGGEVPRGGEKEALGDTEVDTEKASLATTERFEQERGALEAARVAEVARPSPAHARIRSPSKESQLASLLRWASHPTSTPGVLAWKQQQERDDLRNRPNHSLSIDHQPSSPLQETPRRRTGSLPAEGGKLTRTTPSEEDFEDRDLHMQHVI